MKAPILLTGMHRSGGSWVAKMIEGGGGVVHVNEPFNRRHPPGLTPGILRVPPPLAYQHVGPHNEADHLPGFRDMLELRYGLTAELRTNHGVYDLAKAAKYMAAFTYGRARGLRPLIDDPYMVFAAEWLAERLECRVVMLVRHPAGIVSSLKRIGTGWSDNLPDIASQPELVHRYLSSHAAELERAAGQPLDPIGHGALLWLLIHSAIVQQIDRHPEFVVVRYEDLATDPVAGFRDLYERLDLDFDERAERAVTAGSMAGPGARRNPWGRVGMAKTAFQPMESSSNAWAWRDRLSTKEQSSVIERTRTVAERFYDPDELSVDRENAA
ncbi:MAG TPA: sulfotransferase [Gaiellales bacterium]